MNVVLAVLSSLFVVKITWNLTTPYLLQLRRGPDERRQGLALMPYLEAALLSLIVVASSLGGGDSWIHRPLLVGAIGLAVVLGSYVHFVIANMALGWILSRRRSPRGGTDAGA